MRESNHNLPSQNRASVVISNALYDRRAFDSPISTLPLVSSLHHLSYLTSTSPRIREILCVDGGLERLVRIAISGIDLAHAPLQRACTCSSSSRSMAIDQPLASPNTPTCTCSGTSQQQRGPRFKAFSAYSKKSSSLSSTTAYDRALLMTYTLSLQSLVNVGVRGSEHIRTRIVQAGVLALAVRVLKGFLLERARHAAELVEAQELAFRAARSTARLRAISLLNTPTIAVEDVELSPEGDADGLLPPVTRTPTPDAVTLRADDAANVAEEREQDAQDARDDADLESSLVLQEGARTRSATIKSGASPAAEVVHTVEGDAMDVDGPESGDSDGERDLIGTAPESLAPSPTRESMGAEETTPRVDAPLLSFAPFQASPNTPMAHMISPQPSSSSSTSSLVFRFREDDVLLCLQLLAYLSKYPHIRRVFHDPELAYDCTPAGSYEDRETTHDTPADPARNVFSLVEKYTIRPSPSDRSAPRLPTDLMYWAGVVLRNSCRKDETRGGVRQCANHACGRWEEYPRAFAKCRRCRKAKYCSKACQSRAWQSGHRYWCSAREASDHSSHRHGRDEASERVSRSHDASPARGNITVDEDDDEALEVRPHPRTHVLLRGTIPEVTTDEEVFIGGGPGINDPLRVGNLGDAEDVEDGVGRFF